MSTFAAWQRFYALEPWGAEWDDLQQALIRYRIAQTVGVRHRWQDDLLLSRPSAPKQMSDAAIESVFRRLGFSEQKTERSIHGHT
ncbi:MAG: hypothetical protein M0O95_04020 [Clostridiales bacterium]|nr:hypothetical protein [Clostridiales bacterium]MCK9468700.1 hypothetical protein [Porticoccaceae bacterium]